MFHRAQKRKEKSNEQGKLSFCNRCFFLKKILYNKIIKLTFGVVAYTDDDEIKRKEEFVFREFLLGILVVKYVCLDKCSAITMNLFIIFSGKNSNDDAGKPCE